MRVALILIVVGLVSLSSAQMFLEVKPSESLKPAEKKEDVFIQGVSYEGE